MNDFLTFFNESREVYPMHLEIYYSEVMDWYIRVYRKGCGKDGKDLEIVDVQSCDMEYAFAKAHVELKEWLFDNEGGNGKKDRKNEQRRMESMCSGLKSRR